MKTSFADILQEMDAVRKKKLSAKLPEWSEVEGIEIATDLALEQCSSTAAARYKASILDRGSQSSSSAGLSIADLTGGLGVDSWAFSHIADKVFYNELSTKLAKAAINNFKALGRSNIHVSNTDAMRAVSSFGRLDWLFLDPSRRDRSGKKVFLLEDCEPDILAIKNDLFRYCNNIMVKISPMADIPMLSERFGKCLSEVHIVGLGGECKELVCILKKNNTLPYKITVADLPDRIFTFDPESEKSAKLNLPTSKDDLTGKSIIIPGAAILKANCGKWLCENFGWIKLGNFTQIFACEDGSNRIVDILPFNNSNIKALAKKYPHCELTARNLPISTDELRKKMGVASGDDAHIYACTCDFSGTASERLLIVTTKDKPQEQLTTDQ